MYILSLYIDKHVGPRYFAKLCHWFGNVMHDYKNIYKTWAMPNRHHQAYKLNDELKLIGRSDHFSRLTDCSVLWEWNLLDSDTSTVHSLGQHWANHGDGHTVAKEHANLWCRQTSLHPWKFSAFESLYLDKLRHTCATTTWRNPWPSLTTTSPRQCVCDVDAIALVLSEQSISTDIGVTSGLMPAVNAFL